MILSIVPASSTFFSTINMTLLIQILCRFLSLSFENFTEFELIRKDFDLKKSRIINELWMVAKVICLIASSYFTIAKRTSSLRTYKTYKSVYKFDGVWVVYSEFKTPHPEVTKIPVLLDVRSSEKIKASSIKGEEQ